jgi:hypothetical protein
MNIFSSSDDDIPKASGARLFLSRKRANTETFAAFFRRRRVIHTVRSGVF